MRLRGDHMDRDTSRISAEPVFRLGSVSGIFFQSSRMTSVIAGLVCSSGGWNRTSGLHVQSVASRPTATAPERSSSLSVLQTSPRLPRFGKEDSNLHRLIQGQATLPFQRARSFGSNDEKRIRKKCPSPQFTDFPGQEESRDASVAAPHLSREKHEWLLLPQA